MPDAKKRIKSEAVKHRLLVEGKIDGDDESYGKNFDVKVIKSLLEILSPRRTATR